MRHLPAVRLFVLCVTMLVLAAGEAQNSSLLNPAPSSPSDPSLERKIEVFIRSQFSVPPEYAIQLGARSKSNMEGYDTLPVTFIHEDKRTSVEFLVSGDGSTLARLEKFDINNNPSLSIDTDRRPIRGAPTAKVEIINFDDLECPYCGMLNNEILPATMDHYQGLVKIVYKDYPLPNHPWALHAAVDANCLATQSASAYWSYVDFVHSHGHEISGASSNPAKSFLDLDNIADTFGTQSKVNETQLAMCLKKQDASLVNQSLKLGASLGVEATPQVFVDGERLPTGAQPIEKLWPAIDRALRAKGIQPPPGKALNVEHP
jgi:protein-disulfide isomerase